MPTEGEKMYSKPLHDAGFARCDTEIDEVRTEVRVGMVEGDLVLPPQARGLVLFAHGSGSSRSSPRNQHVACILRHRALGTFLLDLLQPEEARDRHRVFDVELLGERLVQVIDWVVRQRGLASMPIGLFGASTGAAAALIAAARRPAQVAAVVSRGGRPDLAGEALSGVLAPTLLIVGGADREVLYLNRAAARLMLCTRRLQVVRGASHLFEEPGALDQVAALADTWFGAHLASKAGTGPARC